MAKDTTSEKKTEKKPGKIRKWFKDLRIEFKKVVWPSRQEVISSTWVVIVSVTIFAVVLGLVDFLLILGMDLIF